MRIKRETKVRLFPFIPLVPMALMIGSLVTAIRALARVRKLERRYASP
jgi:hypothetical protein